MAYGRLLCMYCCQRSARNSDEILGSVLLISVDENCRHWPAALWARKGERHEIVMVCFNEQCE